MSKPQLIVIPVTGFQQNCSILWNEDTGRGAVTDPGGDVEAILEQVAKAKVVVDKILLTHGHLDHAGGAKDLAAKLRVPIEGPHLDDKFLLDTLDEAGRRYGAAGMKPVTPDRWLIEGDTVDVGGLALDVLHCPGHSPGSVVFFSKEHRFCLMGDVLFQNSVGRTDLPGGDADTLIRSIREKLLPLGDDVAFLPGHGPASTIGDERANNPFLQQE
jgi:hydroxyacylglutathione hydrolase